MIARPTTPTYPAAARAGALARPTPPRRTARWRGCLCGAAGYRFEDWLKEILPEGRRAPAPAMRCASCSRRPRRRCASRTWSSSCCCPTTPSPSRRAPRRWRSGARGSSTAWGRAAIPDASELPGEVGEVVRDFIEIIARRRRCRPGRGVERERLRRAGRVRARRRAAAVRGTGERRAPRRPGPRRRCTDGKRDRRETSSRAAVAS